MDTLLDRFSKNAYVHDAEKLKTKLNSFVSCDLSDTFVISDFDSTITTCSSTHSILVRSSSCSPEATQVANQLVAHYHPLETNPNISHQEMWSLMSEWWNKTHALLVSQKIRKSDIPKVIKDSAARLRPGFRELAFFLEANQVPLLIFSGGITDLIEEILFQHLGKHLSNIIIIANSPVWNEEGVMTNWVPDPPFHTLSKTAVWMNKYLESTSNDELARRVKTEILPRKQALLLGDTHGDAKMIEGLDLENVVKCCFICFELHSDMLKLYQSLFDVLILDNGTMGFPTELMGMVGKKAV